jgi:uncharacterized alkaline shock family protein YloU
VTDSDSSGTELANTLVCGTAVDDLLEQVAEGQAKARSAHQRDCVHCQAALTELIEVWAPMQRLVDEPVVSSPGLRRAIKQQIDRLVENTWYTLQLTEIGEVRVAARIVATVARDAARTVPGVRVALGRSTRAAWASIVDRATQAHRHPHAAVGVLGRTAVVEMAIAVQYGRDVLDVARHVQSAVIAALRRDVGLRTIIVNVTVDDVIAQREQ